MADQIQYNASDAEGKFSGLTSIASDLRSISTSKAEGDAGMPVSVTLAETLKEIPHRISVQSISKSGIIKSWISS